jgi:hypothetical protein
MPKNNNNQETGMRGLGQLLEHVPTLVKAYGKWPSYLYLLFATATPLACLALLYQLFR